MKILQNKYMYEIQSKNSIREEDLKETVAVDPLFEFCEEMDLFLFQKSFMLGYKKYCEEVLFGSGDSKVSLWVTKMVSFLYFKDIR